MRPQIHVMHRTIDIPSEELTWFASALVVGARLSIVIETIVCIDDGVWRLANRVLFYFLFFILNKKNSPVLIDTIGFLTQLNMLGNMLDLQSRQRRATWVQTSVSDSG